MTKIPQIWGFFDTETYHALDMKHDGIDVRVVGNEVHIFKNDKDTGKRPHTYVKCASIVVKDDDGNTIKEDKSLTTVDDLLCAFVDNRIDRAYSHNYKFDGAFINDLLLHQPDKKLKLSNGWTVMLTRYLIGKRGVVYEDVLFFQRINPLTHRREKHTIQLRDTESVA